MKSEKKDGCHSGNSPQACFWVCRAKREKQTSNLRKVVHGIVSWLFDDKVAIIMMKSFGVFLFG